MYAIPNTTRNEMIRTFQFIPLFAIDGQRLRDI